MSEKNQLDAKKQKQKTPKTNGNVHILPILNLNFQCMWNVISSNNNAVRLNNLTPQDLTTWDKAVNHFSGNL